VSAALRAIPAELRELRQWVLWRKVIRKGKATKAPYQATAASSAASSTDPATWATFAEALAAWDGDQFGGIGFVFTDTPFAGIDLDHVRDAKTGAVIAEAQTIIDELASYTEASQSGTGVHILIAGEMPEGKGRKVVGGLLPGGEKWEIEAYSTGRYFCCTGAMLGEITNVCERQPQLDALLASSYFTKPKGNGKPSAEAAAAGPAGALELDDAALIEMMLGSANNGFRALWGGDWSAYVSASEGRAALLTHFAWLTDSDPVRMDNMFRSSGLMGPKWDRADLRATDIAAAIECNGGKRYTARRTGMTQREAADVLGVDKHTVLRDLAGASAPPEAASDTHEEDWSGASAPPDPDFIEGEAEDDAREARDLESEAAHAAVLRSKWLGRYRFAAHVNKWKRWDGTVWATVTDSVVADAACKVLTREYGRQIAEVDAGEEAKRKRLFGLYKSACTFRGVSGALAFLRGQDGVHTDVEQWDADPYILNCADGLLDLRTCELRGHDCAAMCTRITAWGLGKDGRASSGAWERHLSMCLPSADVRRQVQRDLGRSLVDAVLEHSLAIWYGIGRNGKSTTSEALLKGLAGYGMEASKDLLVQTKHERHPTEIAELAGARVVFVEETTDGKHLDEAQVKRLTGGGVKRARFMRQDNFNVPQTFSISLLVNHRPHVTGGDPGIWERLRLVPWTTRIPRAEQRPQEEVVAELDADGAYMLRWLVAGFKDWQADHHWIADEVQAATRDYRAEEDVLQGFVDRYCIEGPRLSVPRGELYEVWIADFMRRSPNDPKPSKIAFGKMLRDRGVIAAVEGHANTKVYRGIGLRTRSDREQLEWDETPAN